jgi:hypothetical protein
VGAGILGLGIGAAIASRGRGYDPYYGSYGYYPPAGGYYGYGYPSSYGYGGGYYARPAYGYGYGRHCVVRRQFDPRWGRWVRVRYC